VNDKFITLNHGAGGETMRNFVRDLFLRRFFNPALSTLADAALLNVDSARLAFTTDSYVVKPLEFPGGNIGKLAICGTVNDLAVMGAQPLYLSAGFIIEEGFDHALLERIVCSMAETADAAGVQIVTGDTKVVPRGECDGLFTNTSGVGACPLGCGLCDLPITDGDAIIVSGTLGDHGIAILGARAQLSFQTEIQSDCAALNGLIGDALAASRGVKWMRDPTRGGLAAALAELTEGRDFGALIREADLPVRDDVQAVCELLGFDPMHIANEGKVVLIVARTDADCVLQVLRKNQLGCNAAIIGQITSDGAGNVRVETEVGGVRRLQRPSGELLPRIC
jgi:hydrogenase expression/formation protein HypE